jgi:hypothetical protein
MPLACTERKLTGFSSTRFTVIEPGGTAIMGGWRSCRLFAGPVGPVRVDYEALAVSIFRLVDQGVRGVH